MIHDHPSLIGAIYSLICSKSPIALPHTRRDQPYSGERNTRHLRQKCLVLSVLFSKDLTHLVHPLARREPLQTLATLRLTLRGPNLSRPLRDCTGYNAHFALSLDGYSLLLAPDPSCHRENMVEARPRKVEERRRNGVSGNGLRRIAVTLDID
jgi:hypothetical protein